MDELEREAHERGRLHRGQSSQRILSPRSEEIGLRGEEKFGKVFNLPRDKELRVGGDRGVDYRIPLEVDGEVREFTVDVKSYEKPGNLPLEQSQEHTADIYVLVRVDLENNTEELLGWEWGSRLRKAPVKTLPGHAILNHLIPRRKLRSIRELTQRYREEL